MKITNRYNLPKSIVAAIKNDTYDSKADISISRLVMPPRIVALQESHKDQIEEDASDRVWSLLGKTIHKILEEHEPTAIVEHRFFTIAFFI